MIPINNFLDRDGLYTLWSNIVTQCKGYTDKAIADSAGVSQNVLLEHEQAANAHSDIRQQINELQTKVEKFLDMDDEALDQLSEVAELINSKGTLTSSDIIDNLNTQNAAKALSANQGYQLALDIETAKADAIKSANAYTDSKAYNDAGIRALIDEKAPLNEPAFTGNRTTIANSLVMTSTDSNKHNSHFSMNRKTGTNVGAYSATLGFCGEATGMYSISAGQEAQAMSQSAVSFGAATVAGITTAGGIVAFPGQTAVGAFNAPVDNAQFMVGIGSSVNSRATAFYVDRAGNTNINGWCYIAGGCQSAGWITNGASADFAEYFEWADGNLDNEDRTGKIVALDGDKMRLAKVGDEVFGIISATGAFIGNAAEREWHKKYLTDIFGEILTEEIEVEEIVDEETGIVISPAHTEIVPVLNPDYDPEMSYIPRSERPEWDVVGLVGQIVALDDGTCQVGGKVKPGIDGIGTASDDGTGYLVMKRLDETHIKVLVK